MKLHYQLNAAFTALLLVILTVAGFVIYSLLLNLLVQNEQQQLEQKGNPCQRAKRTIPVV
ncbi:hypothetical protein P5G51_017690 [Virgibacillus sp. 179-BFC.A HS]|uniref:Uncharacterized protein n=1 Tax=Tigheibacillus jepli TaxID=3035914 RepID=A0ABU5CKN5_9BACI|nr:hypothetical protein [Virgibacillus sp. 179-BFC.A HS]MDY0406927.1 hypothetical protein [Virgibacillus sp. 179-BFC.A HS]